MHYPQQNTCSDTAYPVLKVVDIDAARIAYKGNTKTVRLIGVDTPETAHPNKPKGESVYLRFGGEERSMYG